MAKPETWRLDRARYPFSVNLQTRFGDMDLLGHINNVAMAGMFENGRVAFNRAVDVVGHEIHGLALVTVGVEIAYLQDAYWPADIELSSGSGRIGNSSWEIYSAAFQEQGCVATCKSTLVYRGKDGPTRPPPEILAEMEKYLIEID